MSSVTANICTFCICVVFLLCGNISPSLVIEMEPTTSLTEEIPEETVSVANPSLPGEHVVDMEEILR